MALRTVDPDVVTNALHGIYQLSCSAVLVVRFQFARTVALGNSIGDFLQKSASIVLIPVMAHVVTPAYHKWLVSLVAYICKIVGISIAWWLQMYQSALQSSILGALVFARLLVDRLLKSGTIAGGQSHADTYIDETLGWSLALVGLWFQIGTGFSVPFPLSLFMLPISITEWMLRWFAAL